MDQEALKRVPLFSHLSPEELSHVEQIVIPRTVWKKTIIFMEGDEKEAVYFIQEGMVKAYQTDKDGREHIVSLLSSGEMFPHTGFFQPSLYPATTEALVDTHLLAIPIREFEQLMMEKPSIAIKVIDVLSAKIRELQQKLQQVTGHDAHSRILSFLLYLAEKHGRSEGSSILIEMPMTNQELANTIGTTRETVNRLLNRLKKEQIVQMKRSKIFILNKEALKQKLES
jgi:CRP/FNR family transcriptional regulator